MIAVVAGSTGLTGSTLLQNLLADLEITEVISVARKKQTIPHAKLKEVLVTDLSELPSLESKLRGDLYFCCLGTTIKTAGSKKAFQRIDHDAIIAFGKIAKAHEAKSFALISAMGANAHSPIFYNRVKGRTEDDIKALGFKKLLIFQPSLLIGARQEYRWAEHVATRVLLPIAQLLPERMQKNLVTDVATLAERMRVESKIATPGLHVFRAAEI